MTYQHISDLPTAIKNNLPLHAQEIYKAAFNHAWEEYKEPQKRKKNISREETAHRVAWGAVKKKYIKIGDVWQLKKNR